MVKKVWQTDGWTDGRTDRRTDGLNQSYSCLVAAKNRAPLLYPFKLYASFHSHWWVSIWVTVRKRSNWVTFDDYLPLVTLKFYGWPWKTIGHLFYAHSSFKHHLVAIDEFQFELQSGNGQIGFWPLWPWPLTSDRQTDRTIHRAAWLQLKIAIIILCIGSTFGDIYSKYAIVYCGNHFSFDYVCSSAIMYMCDFWCQNIY